MWEMGYLTVLHVRLGAKIGDRHAKDSNAFRKRQMMWGWGTKFFVTLGLAGRLGHSYPQICRFHSLSFLPRLSSFLVMLAKMACRIQRGERLHGRKSVYNALYPLSRKRENLWLAK